MRRKEKITEGAGIPGFRIKTQKVTSPKGGKSPLLFNNPDANKIQGDVAQEKAAQTRNDAEHLALKKDREYSAYIK